jgi:hypothetical protein
MSVTAMAWVWENSQSGGTDRLVLLAIADSADHDGSNAFPAVATIAKKCQVSARTVQRSIRTLVEMGELEVSEQAGHGSRADRRPNLYRVVMDGATERHPVSSDGVTSGDDGVTSTTSRGDTCDANGVTLLSPEPSIDPSLEPSLEPLSRARSDDNARALVPDDDPDRGFVEFWDVWPKRHGRKIGRKDALAKWRRLSLDEKRTAYRAARHYAAACDAGQTLAQDAHRWLTKRRWEDWADDAAPTSRPRQSQPTALSIVRGIAERYGDDRAAS